jgi:hypothetical protein
MQEHRPLEVVCPHRPKEGSSFFAFCFVSCGGTPGTARTLKGSRSGRVALRREQRKRLESKHIENRATGRKVRPSTEVASTALGKE